LRAKRELQQIYCRLYLFSLLDNIKRRTGCFSVDVAQTGSTMYICVSLVLCVFYVFISVIFYVFHCSVIYNFLTLSLGFEACYALFNVLFDKGTPCELGDVKKRVGRLERDLSWNLAKNIHSYFDCIF